MAIQFWNGKVLFVDGKIAMDPRCCCKKQGCYCPDLPDKFKIRCPYYPSGYEQPGDPLYGATYWEFIVRRPIPIWEDLFTPGDGNSRDSYRLYPPPSVGNCCYYGEASSLVFGGGYLGTYQGNAANLNSCGSMFLYLEPGTCLWRITSSMFGSVTNGTRPGMNGVGPRGIYSYYSLWNSYYQPNETNRYVEVMDVGTLPSWWPPGV